MIMATYKKVLDYVDKNELWRDDSIKKYHKEFPEETKERFEKVLNASYNLIQSRVRSFCKLITIYYPSIYLTSCYRNKVVDNNLLCSTAALLEISLSCDYFDVREERDEYSLVFSQLAETWLMLFACNRFELIQHCYPAVINGLKNGMLRNSLPRNRKPQKLGVLAMEMLAREHGDTIDWDEVDIPVEPFYLDFCNNVLLSDNEDAVRSGLTELCNKHLEWTDLRDERHSYITGYEIERVELLLWPFEYQAVKNYRARHGLTTPEIEHPLLTGPMAMAHIPDFASWQRWDWFDPLLDFVAEKKPELAFLKTLFN